MSFSRRIVTPLGPLAATASRAGIVRLSFDTGESARNDPSPFLDRLQTELAAYFEGSLQVFTVPLDLHGTGFHLSVWNLLSKIPYGQTRTYEDLARSLDRPGASRAVGAANGANPVAIVVPCHRVVAKDGSLGGYGGGLSAKRALLELEGALPPGERQRTLW